MEKIYHSMQEVEKDLFPKAYVKRLIEKRELDTVAKYLSEKKIEFDMGLTIGMNPRDVGTLLAKMSLEEIRRMLR